jgi:hypothetical protein
MILQPQTVEQNDYGYELPFTLVDGAGEAVDISLAALSISVQDSQDPTGTILFTGGMAVDSGPDGVCHYTVGQGNFSNPGTFLAQITATWSASEVLTWPDYVTIIVRPKLPKVNN